MAGKPAAFFRMEGVVVPHRAPLAAAWLASNAQQLGQRAMRLGAVALSAPFALGFGDPVLGHRVAWAALRGTSEDRLRVLGEEYAATRLVPAIRPIAIDLIEQNRRDGLMIVLVSDHLEPIAALVAAQLRVDALVANRLEMRNGKTTGRLLDPLTTRFGGQVLASWAEQHGVDLTQSRAYGALADDQLLLSAIPWPCAVHPDRSLRRVARDLDWPVLEAP